MPVCGTVFIAGPGGDDCWGQHKGNDAPSAFLHGCPLEILTVCTMDTSAQVSLDCTKTDANGQYDLASPCNAPGRGHKFPLPSSSTRKATGEAVVLDPSLNSPEGCFPT